MTPNECLLRRRPGLVFRISARTTPAHLSMSAVVTPETSGLTNTRGVDKHRWRGWGMEGETESRPLTRLKSPDAGREAVGPWVGPVLGRVVRPDGVVCSVGWVRQIRSGQDLWVHWIE